MDLEEAVQDLLYYSRGSVEEALWIRRKPWIWRMPWITGGSNGWQAVYYFDRTVREPACIN